MSEGYLITKMNRKDVEEKIKIKIIYDEEISKMLQINIFWVEGKIDRETENKVDGKFFSLDEVMFAGIKNCADNVAMSLYLDKRNAM